jgi:hypothetical protein|nr:hypothetical protein [Kofleriaceae bacterium]
MPVERQRVVARVATIAQLPAVSEFAELAISTGLERRLIRHHACRRSMFLRS